MDAIKILAKAVLWLMPNPLRVYMGKWECMHCKCDPRTNAPEVPHKPDCLYKQVKELADA